MKIPHFHKASPSDTETQPPPRRGSDHFHLCTTLVSPTCCTVDWSELPLSLHSLASEWTNQHSLEHTEWQLPVYHRVLSTRRNVDHHHNHNRPCSECLYNHQINKAVNIKRRHSFATILLDRHTRNTGDTSSSFYYFSYNPYKKQPRAVRINMARH